MVVVILCNQSVLDQRDSRDKSNRVLGLVVSTLVHAIRLASPVQEALFHVPTASLLQTGTPVSAQRCGCPGPSIAPTSRFTSDLQVEP